MKYRVTMRGVDSWCVFEPVIECDEAELTSWWAAFYRYVMPEQPVPFLASTRARVMVAAFPAEHVSQIELVEP